MAFPTNDLTNASSAADSLAAIGRRIRAEMDKYIGQCDAGSVNAHDLVSMTANVLRPARADWNTYRQVSGVQAAIRSRFPGAGFADDAAVTTAMQAVLDAMDSTLSYVVTNTPKDGSGYLLTLQVVANRFVQRTITNGAQLASLRANLVSLRDTLSP